MILDQRSISPERCSVDMQAMKQLIELAQKTDYYFARLFAVKVNNLSLIYMHVVVLDKQ